MQNEQQTLRSWPECSISRSDLGLHCLLRFACSNTKDFYGIITLGEFLNKLKHAWIMDTKGDNVEVILFQLKQVRLKPACSASETS